MSKLYVFSSSKRLLSILHNSYALTEGHLSAYNKFPSYGEMFAQQKESFLASLSTHKEDTIVVIDLVIIQTMPNVVEVAVSGIAGNSRHYLQLFNKVFSAPDSDQMVNTWIAGQYNVIDTTARDLFSRLVINTTFQ